MNIEKSIMEAVLTPDGPKGRIQLDKLADPNTVVVSLQGEIIEPESFDCFGHPVFSEEQEQMYRHKNAEYKRQGSSSEPLLVEVSYEEDLFEIPQDEFDSVEGLSRHLRELWDLNDVLNYRKRFRLANPNKKLNEFMLFGKYRLDSYGQIQTLSTKYWDKVKVNADVEPYQEFRNNNFEYTLSTNDFIIPEPEAYCPCCAKDFTLEDIKREPVILIHSRSRAYHNECWKKYKRDMIIEDFTTDLMSYNYSNKDYCYETIPNGYCNQECCEHIPWFLFHTIDGDIIMGWRKRVISIEWQENYKDFDMRELFKDEEVTKWNHDGKRGIHAWGKDKAYEYVEKVLKAVNPEYKRR